MYSVRIYPPQHTNYLEIFTTHENTPELTTISLSFLFPFRSYRYTAYRQFVRLVWYHLGKRSRKVLPSCIVCNIRAAFPSEEYAGFKYPQY